MEYASGNIFIRPMAFEKAGDVVEGHAHDWDHTTYCVRGGMRIERLDAAGNVERTVEKWATERFNWILIQAGVRHRLIALADRTMGHCIYSHRTPQGEVVQVDTGWSGAHR